MLKQRLSHAERLAGISSMKPEEVLDLMLKIAEESFRAGYIEASIQQTDFTENLEVGENALNKRLFLKDLGLIP